MQITYLPNIRQSAKHHTIQIADYFALVRSGQHLALIEAYRNTKALSKDEQAEAKQQVEEQKPARTARAEKSTFEQVINSPITKQIGKEMVRGVFGMLFGTTPRRSTARRKW